MISKQSQLAFALAFLIHILSIIALYATYTNIKSNPTHSDTAIKIPLMVQTFYSTNEVHQTPYHSPYPAALSTQPIHSDPPLNHNPEVSDVSDTNDFHSNTPSSLVKELIDRHYGDRFNDLSREEQTYVIKNIAVIHKIDRQIGNALIADKPRNTFKDGENNVVEFYLYPDGMISDIEIIGENRSAVLDDITQQTIEQSYSKYPRPKERTLIRIHTKIVKMQ